MNSKAGFVSSTCSKVLIFFVLLLSNNSVYANDSIYDYKIQRWHSYLTYMQEGWDNWNISTTGEWNTYRYPIAHVGYSTAIYFHERTPHYNEVTCKILNSTIERMVRKVVWQYWAKPHNNKTPCEMNKKSHCPDPVIYQNIMYSGHLANLISLYENICHDYYYTYSGWDFVWNETLSIHYTMPQMLDIIIDQVIENDNGGVCCEPDLIFTICNTYPRAAFILYDKIHNTKYSHSNIKWYDFFNKNSIRNTSKYYFNIIYYYPKKTWIDKFYNTTGGLSDAWTLSWLKSWYDDNYILDEAINNLNENKNWVNNNNMMYLNESGRPHDIATSFYLFSERQYNIKNKRDKYILNWLDQYKVLIDTDKDSIKDSMFYNTTTSGKVWTTANALAGLSVSYNTVKKLHTELVSKPLITDVDYPNLIITKTQKNDISFKIQLIAERGFVNTTITIKDDNYSKIYFDGEIYKLWNKINNNIILDVIIDDGKFHNFLLITSFNQIN